MRTNAKRTSPFIQLLSYSLSLDMEADMKSSLGQPDVADFADE